MHGRRIVLALIVPVVALAVAIAETAPIPKEMNGLPLIFVEDFEQGAARWEPTDPAAWTVRETNGNHEYCLVADSDYEPEVRSPKSISWIKDLDVTDFVLEVQMRQTSREYGHRDLCLFFGKQDASHFYYVHLATKADPHANSIFLVNGAPRVSIAEERTDGTDWGSAEVYHTVRIERDTRTGSIKVYYDDMSTPVMTATDTTFTTGAIGLGSFDDTGCMDDVRIWGTKRNAPAGGSAE
jgi:hypothetical protein